MLISHSFKLVRTNGFIGRKNRQLLKKHVLRGVWKRGSSPTDEHTILCHFTMTALFLLFAELCLTISWWTLGSIVSLGQSSPSLTQEVLKILY